MPPFEAISSLFRSSAISCSSSDIFEESTDPVTKITLRVPAEHFEPRSRSNANEPRLVTVQIDKLINDGKASANGALIAICGAQTIAIQKYEQYLSGRNKFNKQIANDSLYSPLIPTGSDLELPLISNHSNSPALNDDNDTDTNEETVNQNIATRTQIFIKTADPEQRYELIKEGLIGHLHREWDQYLDDDVRHIFLAKPHHAQIVGYELLGQQYDVNLPDDDPANLLNRRVLTQSAVPNTVKPADLLDITDRKGRRSETKEIKLKSKNAMQGKSTYHHLPDKLIEKFDKNKNWTSDEKQKQRDYIIKQIGTVIAFNLLFGNESLHAGNWFADFDETTGMIKLYYIDHGASLRHYSHMGLTNISQEMKEIIPKLTKGYLQFFSSLNQKSDGYLLQTTIINTLTTLSEGLATKYHNQCFIETLYKDFDKARQNIPHGLGYKTWIDLCEEIGIKPSDIDKKNFPTSDQYYDTDAFGKKLTLLLSENYYLKHQQLLANDVYPSRINPIRRVYRDVIKSKIRCFFAVFFSGVIKWSEIIINALLFYMENFMYFAASGAMNKELCAGLRFFSGLLAAVTFLIYAPIKFTHLLIRMIFSFASFSENTSLDGRLEGTKPFLRAAVAILTIAIIITIICLLIYNPLLFASLFCLIAEDTVLTIITLSILWSIIFAPTIDYIVIKKARQANEKRRIEASQTFRNKLKQLDLIDKPA